MERLTEAQLGIWLGHQRARDPSVYNAAECIILRGKLDVELFQRALDETLREAVALHVAFPEVNGEPRLVPLKYVGPRCSIVDLSGVDQPERALELAAEEELGRSFAIDSGELFLHRIYELAPEHHAWLHVAHHIALDGYGFNLIQRRVAERYSAAIQGKACAEDAFSAFPPVRLEDERYQASPERTKDRAFWLAELARHPGVRLAPWVSEGLARARRVRRTFWPEELAVLRPFAAGLDADWSDVVLALVAGMVHALSGRTAFSLGLPVMLRLGSRALKTPCMAMNIVALPVACTKRSTLISLIREVRATRMRQTSHRRYRYEHLKPELESAPFGPIVNIMPFDVPLRFGACEAEIIGISAGPIEDLAFGFAPRGTELELIVDAHPEAFTGEELEQIAERFIAVAATWLSNPELSLDVALSRCEKPLTVGEYAWPPARIHEWALERPEMPALIDGERVVTYGELDRAARGFAEQALSLNPGGGGSVVVIQGPRSLATVIAIVGTLYAGLGYSALDPAHPVDRRQRVLDQLRPGLLVDTGTSALDLELAPAVSRLCVDDAAIAAWLAGEGSPPRTPASRAAAYVVFTSGSTGEPKGVVVSAAALAHFVTAARSVYAIDSSHRVLQFAPFTFDASVEELFVTLSSGASLVLRSDAMLDSPRAFTSACEQFGISVLDLPTAYFHELGFALEALGASLPPTVELVIIGGEAAHAERVQRFLAKNPGVRLLNTYGPSEATVVASVADLGRWDGTGGVPIGQPLPGVGVALLDEEGARVEGAGEVGELYLLGPTLASGYLGREDLTRERFVSIPGHGRAYKTGDRARFAANGELVYVGRVDDELKISGYRIAPAEVEAALARHPDVRSAVARGEPLAGGGKRLVAFVEADPRNVDAASLRSFLRGQLPAPMIPSELRVVDALPRTSHGKLDRKALGALEAGPASPDNTPAGDELEAEVLGIWREVLGASSVELDDDFFVLGGNSLQVIQVASRLSRLGREVTVASVFKHPTPRLQAGLVRPLLSAESGRAPDEFQPRDVTLPNGWFRQLPAENPAEPRRVFLTGASGFVGIHLLEAWLTRSSSELVCVVRGSGEAEARARLEATARRYGVELTPFHERYRVLPLDLAARDFTVEELAKRVPRCDLVFHAAAQVSVTRDYASLFPANVLATRELIGLAAEWGSSFHYVSSIATLPLNEATEERFYARHAGLHEGYPQSKWHAESLCEAAGAQGLPVAVYRLGRVSGSSVRPIINPRDLVWGIARSATRLGLWPDLPIAEPWIPVDVAAETLLRLALAGAATTPATPYHVVQSGSVQIERVRSALVRLGYTLQVVPVALWIERLRQVADAEDRALMAFFELSAHAGGPETLVGTELEEISWARVQHRLPDLVSQPVSDALLLEYCRSALASGLLSNERCTGSERRS